MEASNLLFILLSVVTLFKALGYFIAKWATQAYSPMSLLSTLLFPLHWWQVAYLGASSTCGLLFDILLLISYNGAIRPQRWDVIFDRLTGKCCNEEDLDGKAWILRKSKCKGWGKVLDIYGPQHASTLHLVWSVPKRAGPWSNSLDHAYTLCTHGRR